MRDFGFHDRYGSAKERIPLMIFEERQAAAVRVAKEIARLIRRRAEQNRSAVLGLATGATPIPVYAELVRLHREEGLRFDKVETFNLDEYCDYAPERAGSYHRYMQEHLFDHIDIKPSRIHLPDGMRARDEVEASCARYERAIMEAGGLDLQLLGIGRTGHIGFNEPGSARGSVTRRVKLDEQTRLDAAGNFPVGDAVPQEAITMGIGTILRARRIVLMAFGASKAAIVARAAEGEISSDVPASFLQAHANGVMVLDAAAAEKLSRGRRAGRLEGAQADMASV